MYIYPIHICVDYGPHRRWARNPKVADSSPAVVEHLIRALCASWHKEERLGEAWSLDAVCYVLGQDTLSQSTQPKWVNVIGVWTGVPSKGRQ